jgi:hypothetical protein
VLACANDGAVATLCTPCRACSGSAETADGSESFDSDRLAAGDDRNSHAPGPLAYEAADLDQPVLARHRRREIHFLQQLAGKKHAHLPTAAATRGDEDEPAALQACRDESRTFARSVGYVLR